MLDMDTCGIVLFRIQTILIEVECFWQDDVCKSFVCVVSNINHCCSQCDWFSNNDIWRNTSCLVAYRNLLHHKSETEMKIKTFMFLPLGGQTMVGYVTLNRVLSSNILSLLPIAKFLSTAQFSWIHVRYNSFIFVLPWLSWCTPQHLNIKGHSEGNTKDVL